jgi:cytosine/adenosine deaminase-related metal-dependent hydrolase
VALGSDATAPDRSGDMFRHMQQAMHYHRRHFRDASVLPIGQVLEMCTISGAKALGMADRVGSIEAGKAADIVSLDARRAHLYPPNMALHRSVCFANGNDVTNVMVGGEMVLRDGKATRVTAKWVGEQIPQNILQDLATYCTTGQLPAWSQDRK